VDCDKSEDGTYYRACRVWSTDVATKWLHKAHPNANKSHSSPASAEEEEAAVAAPNTKSRGSTSSRSNSNSKNLKPCTYHQNILRGCSLEGVLREAIHMDPDIAFKGSKCTVGLKVESQRRLTVVKRALLALCKGFVAENPENQDLIFERQYHCSHIRTAHLIKRREKENEIFYPPPYSFSFINSLHALTITILPHFFLPYFVSLF
jgi:hypothetical protein